MALASRPPTQRAPRSCGARDTLTDASSKPAVSTARARGRQARPRPPRASFRSTRSYPRSGARLTTRRRPRRSPPRADAPRSRPASIPASWMAVGQEHREGRLVVPGRGGPRSDVAVDSVTFERLQRAGGEPLETVVRQSSPRPTSRGVLAIPAACIARRAWLASATSRSPKARGALSHSVEVLESSIPDRPCALAAATTLARAPWKGRRRPATCGRLVVSAWLVRAPASRGRSHRLPLPHDAGLQLRPLSPGSPVGGRRPSRPLVPLSAAAPERGRQDEARHSPTSGAEQPRGKRMDQAVGASLRNSRHPRSRRDRLRQLVGLRAAHELERALLGDGRNGKTVEFRDTRPAPIEAARPPSSTRCYRTSRSANVAGSTSPRGITPTRSTPSGRSPSAGRGGERAGRLDEDLIRVGEGAWADQRVVDTRTTASARSIRSGTYLPRVSTRAPSAIVSGDRPHRSPPPGLRRVVRVRRLGAECSTRVAAPLSAVAVRPAAPRSHRRHDRSRSGTSRELQGGRPWPAMIQGSSRGVPARAPRLGGS